MVLASFTYGTHWIRLPWLNAKGSQMFIVYRGDIPTSWVPRSFVVPVGAVSGSSAHVTDALHLEVRVLARIVSGFASKSTFHRRRLMVFCVFRVTDWRGLWRSMNVHAIAREAIRRHPRSATTFLPNCKMPMPALSGLDSTSSFWSPLYGGNRAYQWVMFTKNQWHGPSGW